MKHRAPHVPAWSYVRRGVRVCDLCGCLQKLIRGIWQ